LVRNARLPGGAAVELLVVDGVIAQVGPRLDLDASRTIDAESHFLVPAVIDSHVHLDYLPVSEELAAKGISAAIDLAAPQVRAGNPGGLTIVSAGPMLVARGGYPTRSWGRDGYGIEIDKQQTMAQTIDSLHRSGARLIKFSLGAGPDLSDELLRFAVRHAHKLGMKVAVHALADADAAHAAELGADILAHTPVEPLQATTIELWSSKAVITTLAAFGNGPSTAANLLALQRAGATILYGTDLGNTQEVGISCPEIRAMQGAGMKDAEILSAMTAVPAKYFALTDLGAIAPGQQARFLLLDSDPSVSAQSLCKVSMVVSDSET
jgi:imidazolonepropionase-like amidohydrolase